MPSTGSAEGILVIDGPMAHFGMPVRPMSLRVKRGKIVSVDGDSTQAVGIRGVIEKVANADNLAEFGVGLNPLSRRNGDFQEEKKARGSVHAAIGDNLFYGGKIQSAVHIDMVMYRPTVLLDQYKVVIDGEIQLPVGENGS